MRVEFQEGALSELTDLVKLENAVKLGLPNTIVEFEQSISQAQFKGKISKDGLIYSNYEKVKKDKIKYHLQRQEEHINKIDKSINFLKREGFRVEGKIPEVEKLSDEVLNNILEEIKKDPIYTIKVNGLYISMLSTAPPWMIIENKEGYKTFLKLVKTI